MRGGGTGEGGRPEEEDGSVDGGPGCMPIDEDDLEEKYDYGQYPVCGANVEA